MTPLRTAWEALNEDCPTSLLISAWCFFTIIAIIEIILPTFFGLLMVYPAEIPWNDTFQLSADLLYVMDKFSFLLLAFCAISSYMKIHRAVDIVEEEEKKEDL